MYCISKSKSKIKELLKRDWSAVFLCQFTAKGGMLTVEFILVLSLSFQSFGPSILLPSFFPSFFPAILCKEIVFKETDLMISCELNLALLWNS